MPSQEYLIVEHLTTKELTRIFSKVVVNPETKCWEWTSTLDDHGYGLIWYKGGNQRIHRLLYAWAVQSIPKGRKSNIPVLDHVVCDNPLCSNPSHLKLTTNQENVTRSGKSPAGMNLRKTHCKRGHKLPPKQPSERQRVCKTCKSEGNKILLARKDCEEFREMNRQRAKLHYWKKKLSTYFFNNPAL